MKAELNKIIRKVLGVKQKQMIAYHKYPINFMKKLPDFMIIGSQKAATSTLHNYLSLHNKISKPILKEAQFFSANYERGINYYKSIFPICNKSNLIFESTPDYLSHPLAAKECFEVLPNLKIIVTLRNPVERSFSHFNFVKGYGGESSDMTFEKALELEPKRVLDALNLMEKDRYHASLKLSRYGYVRNSEYLTHLQNWLTYYPIKQFHFIDFSDLKQDANKVLNEIHLFLGVEYESIKSYVVANKSNYDSNIKDSTQIMLREHFKDYNEDLFKLIGKRLDW